MIRVSWIQTGSTYRRMEGDITNIDTLPVGIYEVGLSMTGWFLTKTAEKFTFNYKLYNLQQDFLDYVKKTYHNTKQNLGILFNGLRGTGKSVTAKMLANDLNLPIIIVKSMGDNNDGLISYLSSFNFDCIFFFDEFEKQFNEDDSSILQIMDGVYNSEYRKIFLLTTNQLRINENLLSRPSRIRYVREFGNLSQDVVNEYLTDNLKDFTGKDDLLAYIDTLTISTIDILKAIVEEVNIHGIEAFLKTKHSFNVQLSSYDYSTIRGWCTTNTFQTQKLTISNFVEDAKNYMQRFDIRNEYEEMLKNAKNESEKEKIKTKYDKLLHYNFSMDYVSVNKLDKAWDKYKSGDEFSFEDERVVKVDIKNNTVITKDGDYLYFYYIKNPNQRPSLYSSSEVNKSYADLLL